VHECEREALAASVKAAVIPWDDPAKLSFDGAHLAVGLEYKRSLNVST